MAKPSGFVKLRTTFQSPTAARSGFFWEGGLGGLVARPARQVSLSNV